MSEKSVAMTTDKKLYIAVGVLAVLGVALYVQNQKQKAEAATYTAESVTADLPKIEFNDESIKKIDKVVITQAAGDAGAAKEVTLEKKGEQWQVTKPVTAKANDANVKSLLDNLKTLKITELVSPSKDSYAEHDLTEQKALHAVFYKGAEVGGDFYFGKSGGRGQMTRVKDKDGAFAIKGYSSYLYARDLKDWRDREVFKFEDTKAKTVDIVNEHGTFAFVKDGENWKGKFKKAKEPAGKEIAKFDQEKVKDLLRAYKALSADGFADGKSAAETGLDKPVATVTIVLDDGAKKTLEVGKTAEGTARWARASGVSEIISIGSWNAEWATAELSKFQKTGDGGAPATPPPSMPEMGMPGMGMPPGMGDPHGGMH